MSSTARSLVMGVHTGIPARLTEPFARSLHDSGFKGTFVVFAGLCGDEDLARLRELADLVVDLDAEYAPPSSATLRLLDAFRSTRGFRRAYPFAFQAAARTTTKRTSSRRWSSLEYHLEGLQALRYLHYHHYLSALEPAPDAIMLTDLRDVLFQRDPFEDPVADLELYLEDDSVRIGQEPFNTRWIRDLYGRRELRRLTGRPVSCSGTVIGTTTGVLHYLGEMMGEVLRHRRPMGSHDQGAHNALLQRGRLPLATVVANGTGRVLTMGKMARYDVDRDGTVLNANGTVPAVLHQWDRHGELAARMHTSGSTSVTNA